MSLSCDRTFSKFPTQKTTHKFIKYSDPRVIEKEVWKTFQKGSFLRASNLLDRLIAILESNGDTLKADLARLLQAQSYLAEEKYSFALKKLQEVYANFLRGSIIPQSHELYGVLFGQLCLLCQKTEEYDRAIKWGKLLYQWCSRKEVDQKLHAIEVLFEIANIYYFECDNHQDALVYYQEVINSTSESSSRYLMLSACQIGSIHLDVYNNHRVALEWFQRSSAYYSESHEDISMDYAYLLFKYGEAYSREGTLDFDQRSILYFDQALLAYSNILLGPNIFIFKTHVQLGQLYFNLGMFMKSSLHLEEAVNICRELHNGKIPQMYLQLLDVLACCYSQLGNKEREIIVLKELLSSLEKGHIVDLPLESRVKNLLAESLLEAEPRMACRLLKEAMAAITAPSVTLDKGLLVEVSFNLMRALINLNQPMNALQYLKYIPPSIDLSKDYRLRKNKILSMLYGSPGKTYDLYKAFYYGLRALKLSYSEISPDEFCEQWINLLDQYKELTCHRFEMPLYLKVSKSMKKLSAYYLTVCFKPIIGRLNSLCLDEIQKHNDLLFTAIKNGFLISLSRTLLPFPEILRLYGILMNKHWLPISARFPYFFQVILEILRTSAAHYAQHEIHRSFTQQYLSMRTIPSPYCMSELTILFQNKPIKTVGMGKEVEKRAAFTMIYLMPEALPLPAKLVLYILNLQGFPALIYGGFIRDTLIGRRPQDIDLFTSASYSELIRIFCTSIVLKGMGKEHTARIHMHGMNIDLRSLETGKNEITEEEIAIDCKKRDFTLNAFVWNPLTQTLHDPERGMESLLSKSLSFVPYHSKNCIQLSPIIMLRALYIAQESNLSLDKEVGDAILRNTEKIYWISLNILANAIHRLGACMDPPAMSDLLKRYNLFGPISSRLPMLHATSRDGLVLSVDM